MKILSIDSSTESASCAIFDENRLMGEISFNYKKQHSVILMPMIEALLNNISLNINDIDGYVISKGPGSFTGLRIGMATVKGLSQPLNKPVAAVSTLDALAYNMSYTSGIICPILDALRGNVYTALYKFEKEELVKITDYMIISVDELIALLKEKGGKLCFIGDGINKFKEKLSEELEEVLFAPSHLNLARASSLGEIGLKLLKEGVQEDVFTLSPIYLRKSQAEQEYEKKHGEAAI